MNTESILDSIKIKCGLVPEETHFDQELIMDINSVFMILNQLGVGPKEGFSIHNGEAVWDQYMPDDPIRETVKNYMGIKVKLMFDNSTMSSAVIEVLNRQISELEWRLNVAVDPGKEDTNAE